MNRKIKLIALCVLYIILSLFAVVFIVLPLIPDNSSTEVMASVEDEVEEISTETEVIEESSEEEEEETTTAIQESLPETAFPITFTNRTKSNVHIRNTGSMDGKIIGKIPPGKKGLITDFLNSEWAMVSYNEIQGYSAFRYFLFDKKFFILEDTPELKDTPKTEDTPKLVENILTPEISQEETTDDIVTIINNCYIRSSTNSHTMENVIDIAKTGNTYPHDLKNDTDYWCCIILSDKRLGFVSRGFTDCP